MLHHASELNSEENERPMTISLAAKSVDELQRVQGVILVKVRKNESAEDEGGLGELARIR